MNRKKITILGSTGSIGKNALDVIRQNRDYFEVVALSCNENILTFYDQIKEFNPEVACVYVEEKAHELKKRTSVKVLSGDDGLKEIVSSYKTDLVLVAIVGIRALLPAFYAISTTKILALANKEVLVAAGDIIKREAVNRGCKLIPVDSEHSAIYQLLYLNEHKRLDRIVLTASGGPFLNYKEKDLENVTIQEVLKHPTWKMGPKVTVDSATMMNKGLEIIEAGRFFDLKSDKIGVLIHPESIVHGMAEFIDGSLIAHMSYPDMRIPISFALYYPEKSDFVFSKLSIDKLNSLTFREPRGIFQKSIELARQSLIHGKSLPLIYNSANEVAVSNFLDGKISFLDIFKVVEMAVGKIKPIEGDNIFDLIQLENEVRKEIEDSVQKWCNFGKI